MGRHPREWAKSSGSVKLYLYFCCSRSLERVSNKSRIKLRYSRDWLKAIAPALNMSLDVLKLGLGISFGRDCPLDYAKIKAMDEWVKDILANDDKTIIEKAKSNKGNSKGKDSSL